ncbi:MAG: ComEC/Rec2 family competence protein [Prevotellaceae bacterium]|nr:ComEC/Rec2 family competence protein [Prevotellaceae bacterium]
MNWQNYPLIRLVLPFVLGMAMAHQHATHVSLVVLLVICCALLSSLFFLLNKAKGKYQSTKFGIVAMALSFSVGMALYIHKHRSIAQGIPQDNMFCKGVLSEVPKEKDKSWALNLEQDNGTHIILYIGKNTRTAASDSVRFSQLNIGDTIFADITHLNATTDCDDATFAPYRKHLFSHGVCATCYAPSHQWHSHPQQATASIFHSAKKLQQKLHDIYDERGINGKSGNIIEAMTIGMTDNLDKDTRRTYATAGTSHVLAMSGLHVGLIAMALQFFFITNAMPHHWIGICNICIIAILWCFAIVAGMSPSLTRATLMFTILLLCQSFTHELLSLNSCALAVAIMLCINPLYINDVGFQLSFASVAGIGIASPLARSTYPPPFTLFTFAKRDYIHFPYLHRCHGTARGIPLRESFPPVRSEQYSHYWLRLYHNVQQHIMVGIPVAHPCQLIVDQHTKLVSRDDEQRRGTHSLSATRNCRMAS